MSVQEPLLLRVPSVLTFRRVTYTIDGGREVLRGVSGHVRGGELLAVLGPSGAGKSTLLDILAQRPKSGKCGGDIRLNGRPIEQGSFRRISAYVQQEDLLQSYLTVRESIFYAAQLRTPPHLTKEQLNARTQNIMSLLRIDGVQDTLIGSEVMRGISGGEKKRCAIAIELVAAPSLLFLDEPTTGLDTFTALHLLTILKDLAAQGVAVVFSIHQPRSGIFRLFDQVLLLNSDGEEAYFGPATEALPFLASIGITPSEPDNPADFLLDTVSAIPPDVQERTDWLQRYKISAASANGTVIAEAFRTTIMNNVERDIDDIVTTYDIDGAMQPLAKTSPYFRGMFTQIRVVATRAVLNKIRDPIATFAAVIAAIFFAVLIGSVYFKVGLSESSVRNRMGLLFYVVMNTTFSSLGSLGLLMLERAIFVREHRNGMYRAFAYLVGKIVQDVPISVLTNLIFNAIVYFMVGLQSRADKFFIFYFICTLVMLNSYALCLFISNISKNIQVANIVAPLVFVLYLLPSGGVLMDVDSLPIAWRWIKYISFVRYGLAALVVNEFDGLVINCPPNTTTCISDGNMYAELQGFNKNDLWCYVGAIAGGVGIYLLLAYIALLFLRTGEGK
ncbi:ATP-binding protein cassette protein [Trypanosoma theileri]|uniref:ATP-binding protein cassette protein n=1 Tax=Trypanosoma theileri TaxID=67003 RepID=A0A1X0NKI4_9TRYP|nr:ATP-binding protein cassette protein [Trypanosoma theileri]ORC85196.1 ATP-binding protein cassette protein [Trypanosoma theileri]